MGDADKFRKISDDLREKTHFAEEQRLGRGKIEFDELGNSVWVPSDPGSDENAMQRLLHDPTLAISEDYQQGTNRLVKKNPVGLKKGYDPYDSGLLDKKQYKKKKDLKKLSAWIESRKPKED